MGAPSFMFYLNLVILVVIFLPLLIVAFQVWRLLTLKVQQNEIKLAHMKKQNLGSGDGRD